jgi:hypothetical protein
LNVRLSPPPQLLFSASNLFTSLLCLHYKPGSKALVPTLAVHSSTRSDSHTPHSVGHIRPEVSSLVTSGLKECVNYDSHSLSLSLSFVRPTFDLLLISMFTHSRVSLLSDCARSPFAHFNCFPLFVTFPFDSLFAPNFNHSLLSLDLSSPCSSSALFLHPFLDPSSHYPLSLSPHLQSPPTFSHFNLICLHFLSLVLNSKLPVDTTITQVRTEPRCN